MTNRLDFVHIQKYPCVQIHDQIKKKFTDELFLVDVSDIFYFFLLGEGEGEVRGREGGGGDRFCIENPRRGGGVSWWEGAEGPGGSAAKWGTWGGLKFFFPGPKCPPNFAGVQVRESPSTRAIMHCASRWTSGWTSRCGIRYGYGASFPFQKGFKGFQAHLDGHLDVHPDVHLDVQLIIVIVLGLSLSRENICVVLFLGEPMLLCYVRKRAEYGFGEYHAGGNYRIQSARQLLHDMNLLFRD